MGGWIKLYRQIQDSPLYRQLNSKQRDVMINVLLMANHKENEWVFKGETFKVKPGQFITSLDGIKEKCASDVTIQNIRTCLLKLEKSDFLTNESTNKNRLITVVNWDIYQGDDDELTSNLTSNQQATNKQLTTNKNVKKEKKKHYADNITLTESEYEKLCAEYGKDLADGSVSHLSSYKIEQGYKTKSDYLTIKRWVIDAIKKKGYTKSIPYQPKLEEPTQIDPYLEAEYAKRMGKDTRSA